MPEESLAAYINNTTTLMLFVVFTTILFFIIFFISNFLTKGKDGEQIAEDRKFLNSDGVDIITGLNYRKDPDLGKNLLMLGSMFVFFSFFMILTLACLNYKEGFLGDSGIFIILSIIFLSIMETVYLIKSNLLE